MSDAERIEKLRKPVFELFTKNRRQTEGFQYTVPSPDTYPYQWLWDSCFHAVILSCFDIESAKKELVSLFSKQFGNGMIPHIIYWEEGEVIRFEWGKEGTSTITQPPLPAYAVWEVYRKGKDKAFLEKVYPNLYHFYNYLLSERDPRHHHLAGIINPDESGEDNSPRFDAPLNLPAEHTLEENAKQRIALIDKNRSCDFDAPFCMKNFFWVKDVPFNAILVQALQTMSRIASEVGKQEDAQYFVEQGKLVADAMRGRMLEKGVFWPIYGSEHTKMYVKTWAIFAPMFAGIATREEAEYVVVNYLRNTAEFATPFSVPTVAQSEDAYNPEGFWRGPIWSAPNWFIFKGLMNYGFEEDAARIRGNTLSLIERSGFREYFHPQTGAGLGARDFTWGGLVLDMIEENTPPEPQTGV